MIQQASVTPTPVYMRLKMAARRILTGLALALILAGAATADPVRQGTRAAELLISDERGALLGVLPLVDGRFDYVFVHSIHLTLVEELFRVDAAGMLRLFELRYESSGVGMPADAEGGYRLEDGRFVLSMDRVFGSIPLFVSIVPGHGVSVGDGFHPFTEWADPEDVLVITARVQ
jgi:hypothetical protein